MKNRLTAVILGASRGLGYELACLCEKRGWHTVRIARSYTDAESEYGRRIRCDLGSKRDTRRCAEEILELGEIDRFYWVAGRMLRGDFLSCETEEVYSTVDVNFRNPLSIAQAVWRRQQEATTTTRFIAVSSTAAESSKAGEAVYAATKAAQVSFLRSIAKESTNDQVRVTLVLPGGMKTGLWDKFPNAAYASFSDARKVADRIISVSEDAKTRYTELTIPRGLT